MNLPLPPVLCHTSGLDEQYTDVQMFEYALAARKQALEEATEICKVASLSNHLAGVCYHLIKGIMK